MKYIYKEKLLCLLFLLASAPWFGLFIDTIFFKNFQITLFFIRPFHSSYLGGDGGLSAIFDILIAAFVELALVIVGLTNLFLKYKRKEKISDLLHKSLIVFIVAVFLGLISCIILS